MGFVLDTLDKLEKGRPLICALGEAWEGSPLEAASKAMEESEKKAPPAPETLPAEAPTDPASPKAKKCVHRKDPARCPNCMKTPPVNKK
jgi:hypothetical protein